MKKIPGLSLAAIMLCGASYAHAESKVVTTVNGTPENRELVRITFDGDNAILSFADNTTETADMSLVSVSLNHDDSSALDAIIADPEKPAGLYNLRGERVADTPEGLTKGIYIVNGQKMLVK